jgi:type IV pilus assembly protein PilC
MGELSSITRSLSVIIIPGRPIAGAIDLLAKQTADKRIAEALSQVASAIGSGSSLEQAFQKHELLFSPFFCTMVAHGEASGNVGLVFLKLSEYYEKRSAFQNKIIRLLRYPLFVLLGTTGCFITLFLFLIPMGLQKVRAHAGVASAASKIETASAFLQMHALESVFISILVLAFFYWLRRSNRKSPWLSTLTWNIPVIGDALRKNALQRFALALSTLATSGFTPVYTLTIAARELRNGTIEKRILHALIDLNESRSIFSILKELAIFPPLIIDTALDEKRPDQSNDFLIKIAHFYQDEVEAAFNAFIILIGPVFVASIGLLGLGVLISMNMPVLKVVGIR